MVIRLKVKSLLYHILFWVVIMASFAISEWGYRQSFLDAIVFEFLFLPSRLFAVYINWFVLIPKYLHKSKLMTYFVSLLFLLLVLGIGHRYFVLYWGFPNFFPEWVTPGESLEPFNLPRLFQSILIIVSPVAFTTGFKLFMDWFEQRKETEALKQEKTEAELKFLKSQTNPHFLFNTLNSIYGLALEKSEKTPSLILKLSDILNYTLYESNTEKISITKELTLIENIISLEKERYDKRVKINFKVNIENNNIEIPPLILIPFVENAFKHGMRNESKKGFIDITLNANSESLYFTIKNSFSVSKHPKAYGNGGLGLKNVSRRLDLIYGKNKQLNIHNYDDVFVVELVVKFKST